jgi:hypothetical protein
MDDDPLASPEPATEVRSRDRLITSARSARFLSVRGVIL